MPSSQLLMQYLSNWTKTKQILRLQCCLKVCLTQGSLAVDKYASKLYQPPRKVPGFSKLLELLNISIFVCLKLYFSFEVLYFWNIPELRTLAHCSTQVSLSAWNTLGRPFPGWTTCLWNWSKLYWLIPFTD